MRRTERGDLGISMTGMRREIWRERSGAARRLGNPQLLLPCTAVAVGIEAMLWYLPPVQAGEESGEACWESFCPV